MRITIRHCVRCVATTALICVVSLSYSCDGGEDPPDPFCGDGNLDFDTEECDNGDLNSDSEPGACRLDCTLPYCGDDLCDPNEDWNTCEGDCPGVGAPCHPDDPNACSGLRATGLQPECIDALAGSDFPDGYCSARCDAGPTNQCEDAGGICDIFPNIYRCFQPCSVSTECRSEQGYQCCAPLAATTDVCMPDDAMDCH